MDTGRRKITTATVKPEVGFFLTHMKNRALLLTVIGCVFLTAACRSQRTGEQGRPYDDNNQIPEDVLEKLPDLASSGKYDEALNLVRPYAERGNAEAEFSMALGLDLKGGNTNNAEIVKWARKAASQNYAQALGFLVNAYRWGEYGLPTNYVMSAMWESAETNSNLIARCLDYERHELTATNASSFPPPSPMSQATLDKINKMTPIFDGQTLNGWDASVKGTNQPDKAMVWTVKDGALASLGVGRGVLYTDKAYGNYRIIFTMRHVSGNKDHQACVLIYCDLPQRSAPLPLALDALGGVQFQVPNGGHWDYRPGHNNGGKGEFKNVSHPKFDVHQWSEVEILVNTNGSARMAVAQPPGTKAYEVLDFDVPDAGKPGVFALQVHNKGLFDEYKDIRIEENPAEDILITTQ